MPSYDAPPPTLPHPINPHMPPPQFPLPLQVYAYSVGQEVEVYIRTNRWVAGVIMGALSFFGQFAGWGYEISYRSASGQARNSFPSQHVRPRQNPGTCQ